MENVEIKINGMHCTGCSSRLEKILNNLDGIEQVKVDFENKIANINYNKEKITLEEIKESIEDAGFEVEGE